MISMFPSSSLVVHVGSLFDSFRCCSYVMRSLHSHAQGSVGGEGEEGDSIREKKRQMRGWMNRRLGLIANRADSDSDSNTFSVQSEDICSRILSSSWYQKANCIAMYLSMPRGEVNLNPVVRSALLDGKRVFVPRIHAREEKAGKCTSDLVFLEIRSVSELDSLPRNAWGIPEPVMDGSESELFSSGASLDVVLVPGLAFDSSGRRLGRGKGYYDRFFHSLKERGFQPRTVGVAFREQVVDSVPVDSSDVFVDFVLTPDQYMCSSSSQCPDA